MVAEWVVADRQEGAWLSFAPCEEPGTLCRLPSLLPRPVLASKSQRDKGWGRKGVSKGGSSPGHHEGGISQGPLLMAMIEAIGQSPVHLVLISLPGLLLLSFCVASLQKTQKAPGARAELGQRQSSPHFLWRG